jgi:rod shape determining protein RodA
MNARRWLDYNFYLLFSVIVLLGFGTAMVYSTVIGTWYPFNPWALSSSFVKHLIFMAIGFAAMIGLTIFDYHNLQLLAKPIYVVTIVILLYVTVAGQIAGGARSWLVGASGQPSEPAKLLLIISLAAWWSRRDEPRATWTTLLGSLALVGVPLVLVLLQPDFGTSMVIAGIWLAMAWGAGMTWKQMAILALIAVPLLYVAWNDVLADYQRGRLIAQTLEREEIAQIADPETREAVEKVFYNLDRSKEAIGNGGLLGQGWLNGVMNQRRFLPVAWTDFVFAVTAEELGFVGATVMLGFICLVLWQSLTVAARARDTFGRLLAIGVFGMLLSHTVENVGMNMGLMPVTGIPLPFISYGGSFTITVLASIGLLQSIEIRRRTLVF